MSAESLHMIQSLHAITAWVATAALLAMPWALTRGWSHRRLMLGLGAGALVCVTLTGALGLLLEGPYRSRLKQRLFAEAPTMGWLFERKEHFAFGAILLVWSGLATLGAAWLLTVRAQRQGAAQPLADELVRGAKTAWTAASIFALAASIAATIVARHVHF